MNSSRVLALVSAAVLLLATLALAQSSKKSPAPKTSAAEQSFSGTVSDSMCGKNHMMAGSSPADCTRACVKEGSDYALVSGDKVYTLKGDKAAIDKVRRRRGDGERQAQRHYYRGCFHQRGEVLGDHGRRRPAAARNFF